jgi:hypothetical protein
MQIARVDIATTLMTRSLLGALPKTAFDAAAGKDAVAQQAQTAAAPQQGQQVANQAIQNVAMLVTIAATDPAIERRRKAAVEADRGLKSLENLHAELLRGTAQPERLRELAEWTASAEVPADPYLAALYREIDVRVRVELAKFDIEA